MRKQVEGNEQFIIRQANYLQCPICYDNYDDDQRYPMIICPEQHSICKHCAVEVLFKFGDESACTQCGAIVHKKSLSKFKFLHQLQKNSDLMKRHVQNPVRAEIDSNRDILNELKQQKQQNGWLLKQNEQKEKQIKKLKTENLQQEQVIIKLKNQLRELKHNLQHEPLINAKDIVYSDSNSYQNLIFNGSQITAQADSDIFLNKKLQGLCSFTATFLKISGVVGLGVTDAQYRHGNLGPKRIFYGCDGYCFDGVEKKFNQGHGFKVGETITVFVDFNKSLIEWRVGSKVVHQLKSPILKQPKTTWVGRIYLGQKGNSVDLNL